MLTETLKKKNEILALALTTSGTRPEPSAVMLNEMLTLPKSKPKARNETWALAITPKRYSSVIGFWSRKTRTLKPPTRPKLRLPSTISPFSWTLKWPFEFSQPEAFSVAIPKKSIPAEKPNTHSPLATNCVDSVDPEPTVTFWLPPTWMMKLALNFSTSRILTSPESARRKECAPTVTPESVRARPEVLMCSWPEALTLKIAKMFASIETLRTSASPPFAPP